MDIEREILELKQRIEKLESIILANNIEVSTTANKSQRDTSRYMFQGKIYPKNRLVLAIIKEYVAKYNPTNEELKSAFDKSLQGSLNVVEDYSAAMNIKDYAKRYFFKDEDVITLKDNSRVVVCTQWGIFNIAKFIKCAETLGFVIEII